MNKPALFPLPTPTKMHQAMPQKEEILGTSVMKIFSFYANYNELVKVN